MPDTFVGRHDVNTIAAAILNVVKALQHARARIAELEDALAVKTADAEGCKAMYVAYRDHNPDSPLRVASGKRHEDGRNKLRLTRLGIANPATRRAD